MKEIKAFKLSDGTVIEDKATAEKLEKDIIFRKEAEKFAEKYGRYEAYYSLRDAIIDQADELFNILKNR